MQRREFITAICGAALAVPFEARSQQSTRKIPVVAVLWHGDRERELASPFFHWFREGFAEVGLKIGSDVILEDYFADESDAKYDELAPQLAETKPDLLVAITAPPALALAKTHGNIPLVFVWVSDPLGLGLVDGLAKRTQNVTGASSLTGELTGKRLEVSREAVPSLSHIALLVNPKTKYETERDLTEYRRVAAKFNIAVDPVDIAEFDQVDEAFAKIRGLRCNGIAVSITSIFGLMLKEIGEAAIAARVPMMGNTSTAAARGALVGYGPLNREGFTVAGKFVKRILTGERARDVPIEQPTRFELAINTKTASALGIELSASLLARADRVFE